MSISVPTIEPTSVRAGDTWIWKRILAEFPASTWTLSYVLINAAGKISITAAADGDDHLVTVAFATTAGYTAGHYDWVASVTDGSSKYQIGSGAMQVLPDLAAADTYDIRTHAHIVLDAIRAMLEERATDGDLDVVSSATGGRSTSYDPAELQRLHKQYAAQVALEEQAAARARGDKTGRIIQTRFINP